MTRAYSEDIRERALAQADAGEPLRCVPSMFDSLEVKVLHPA